MAYVANARTEVEPMPALATWTPEDGLLGAVAPLGLAASQPTALLVDLDPEGPRYRGSGSLADLERGSPRRDDLAPQRRGLAVLRNGGISPEDAAPIIAALVAGWPRVVLRLPPRPEPSGVLAPVVRVETLLPGDLFPRRRGAAVYQAAGWRVSPPGPGPVLPPPRPATLEALLVGRMPFADRWLLAWRRVWKLPWR